MIFTVVVPVFRTEKHLKRCLDSFASQTERDFEVIVVDDGSPDGTAGEIVARYDARFKYVRHEKNRSLFQARQTGLRMAQGEFVIPFDSDDYAMPELLARLRGEIESSSETDVIVYQMMYDDGCKITKPSVRYRDERLSGAAAQERFFASRIQCGICGKAVRRETYLKAMDELALPPDFYLNSSEDLCQTFPVLANARRVSTLAYPGYRYWHNGDSLTGALADSAKLGQAVENTHRVFGVLADFVRRNDYDASLLSRLDAFERTTIRWYLGRMRHLTDAKWCACAAELCRHFEPSLVAREAMLLIEQSAAFRAVSALRRLFH